MRGRLKRMWTAVNIPAKLLALMKTHDFRLILETVPSADEADAIYAVIDDGTFGVVNGVAEVWFDRCAESLETAIESAISDVKTAGFGVKKVEIEADGFPASAVA